MPYTEEKALAFARQAGHIICEKLPYHVLRSILFGSYAKGKPTNDSDVDIAFITPRTITDPFDHASFVLSIQAYLEDAGICTEGAGCVHVTTFSEQELMESAEPVIISINKDGIALGEP